MSGLRYVNPNADENAEEIVRYPSIQTYNLPDGKVWKKGEYTEQTYPRKFGASKEYDNLVSIVAGLQKDVKRINKCITKAGAENWIATNNKHNWTAHEMDIVGPNGEPDGVNEVFVTDGKGNIKIINGYGLAGSKYKERKAYHTMLPTKEARKAVKFNDWKERMDVYNADVVEGEFPGYLYDVRNKYPEFGKLQSKVLPKKLFYQQLIKPAWEAIKKHLIELKSHGNQVPEGMVLAQIYNKSAIEIYNQMVVNKAFEFMGINPEEVKPSKLAKIKRSEEFMYHCGDITMGYIKNGDPDEIKTFVLTMFTHMMGGSIDLRGVDVEPITYNAPDAYDSQQTTLSPGKSHAIPSSYHTEFNRIGNPNVKRLQPPKKV